MGIFLLICEKENLGRFQRIKKEIGISLKKRKKTRNKIITLNYSNYSL